jgi:endonuclease I
MRHFLCILVLVVLLLPLSGTDYLPPEYYYQDCHNLKGDELKAMLHEIISGHKVFPYFSNEGIATADILQEVDEDPANPDNIVCFYSGFSYSKSWIDKGRKTDYSALGTTHDNSWNREHVWSKSHGFPNMDEDIAYSDVHNLRPEDRTINSAKGAKDFDWGGYPNIEADFCFSDADSWEAPMRVKGDIARCIFYMSVRYEGSDTPYDLEIVDYTNTEGEVYGRLSTLLEWHELDPPDEYEKRRNHLIYVKYQNNRNPFIDHPEFVSEIWGKPETNPRISTSVTNIYFDAVQGSPNQKSDFFVTAVNQKKNLSLTIEEYPNIFYFANLTDNMDIMPHNQYINQQVEISFSPEEAGEYVSSLLFSNSDHEVLLQAKILPIDGEWLINEDFDDSLGDFTHSLRQGNYRYGWHHSSWDNDTFAKLQGDYDDHSIREAWLISPILPVSGFSDFYLNFRSARNELKSPNQLQVYFTSQIPDQGFPNDALRINPLLSNGNYNWQNSSWLNFNKNSLPPGDKIYLLFRYYYDGNSEGQETWEIDDVKYYGKYSSP